MIITKYGDMLDENNYSSDDINILVHGCNAQGVMGSGIAKQIKDKWPGAYESYLNGSMELGDGSGYIIKRKSLAIFNLITQNNYGRDPKQVYVDYDAIRIGFRTINYYALIADLENKQLIINFPLIGCGQANGDWNIVSKIIDKEIDDQFKKVLWKLK